MPSARNLVEFRPLVIVSMEYHAVSVQVSLTWLSSLTLEPLARRSCTGSATDGFEGTSSTLIVLRPWSTILTIGIHVLPWVLPSIVTLRALRSRKRRRLWACHLALLLHRKGVLSVRWWQIRPYWRAHITFGASRRLLALLRRQFLGSALTISTLLRRTSLLRLLVIAVVVVASIVAVLLAPAITIALPSVAIVVAVIAILAVVARVLTLHLAVPIIVALRLRRWRSLIRSIVVWSIWGLVATILIVRHSRGCLVANGTRGEVVSRRIRVVSQISLSMDCRGTRRWNGRVFRAVGL